MKYINVVNLPGIIKCDAIKQKELEHANINLKI